MSVKPIPEGFQQAIPYLVVPDAAGQMDFLIKAFDGEEMLRMKGPGGIVMHGEVKIGDSVIMIGQAMKDNEARNTMIYLYVKDCDAIFKQALNAGGTVVSELADQFYGDRHGAIKDPYNNDWYIATHIEDVTEEQMAERTQNMGG